LNFNGGIIGIAGLITGAGFAIGVGGEDRGVGGEDRGGGALLILVTICWCKLFLKV